MSSLKAGDEQHVYFSLEMARAGLPKAKQLAVLLACIDDSGWICDPMCLCLEHAIQKCHNVAKEETEKFGILLDQLKPGPKGEVARLLSFYQEGYGGKFLGWMIESRPSCKILQAADFAAYHAFRFLRDSFNRPGKAAPSVPYYRFHQESYREPRVTYFDEAALRDFDEAKRRGERIVSITLGA